MAEPPEKSDVRFTYAQYVQWPPEERWELIEGVPYSMTPAPAPRHQRILRALFLQIAGYLEGKPCEPFFAPLDLLLPEGDERDEEVRTVVQPDLLVVCDSTKVTPKGVRGAPDLICEVLSPSTARKDQVAKLNLYEKHGVREYWILHPEERFVTIYRMGSNDCYSRPVVREAEGFQEVEVLPGLTLDLSAIFAVPDPV